MADSVATELLYLIELAGLALNIKETPLEDGSVDRTVKAPFPLKRVVYYVDDSGVVVTIAIPQGQCFVITHIDVFGVDFADGTGGTVTITNSTDSVAAQGLPLRLVNDTPLLFVFPPGTATLTFSFILLPEDLGAAAARITGYRLPQQAINILGRISNETQFFQ